VRIVWQARTFSGELESVDLDSLLLWAVQRPACHQCERAAVRCLSQAVRGLAGVMGHELRVACSSLSQ